MTSSRNVDDGLRAGDGRSVDAGYDFPSGLVLGDSPQQPRSARWLDTACVVFALWTACCFAIVTAGGSLRQLLALFSVALAVLLALRTSARFRSPHPGSRTATAEHPRAAEGKLRLAGRAAGLVIGVSVVVAYQQLDDVRILWWGAVALLGAALTLLTAESPRAEPPARGRGLEIMLWSLAGACLIVTLVSHRPDADDSFYVNVAVAAADHPDAPLLATDTLHGIKDLPLHQPVYRVHSLEVLNGAVSYLTGIPAIYCFHWICASLAALMVPLAYARLFRLLLPRHWLGATVIVVLLLLLVGETHRWYSNFAFVRIWHGKSIFLAVLLPMVYTYAMEFGLRPSRRGWMLLCAVQIAAVGCTSSALWAGPASAAMALLAVVQPTKRGMRALGVGAFGSIVVLTVGWFIKLDIEQAVAGYEHQPDSYFDGMITEALKTVLGDGNLALFALVATLTAWTVLPRGLAQRFAVTVPFVVFAFLLNPFATRWLVANLTGGSYWRTLWALPIPILMTFVLISPWSARRRFRSGPGLRWATGLVLLGSFVVLVPKYSALSSKNGVEIKRPGLKVPAQVYRQAEILNRSVEPGSYVVAPSRVSAWVPTFHHHAYPLRVRQYLRHRSLGVRNRRARATMTDYVNGKNGKNGKGHRVFAWGLDAYDVRAVMLRVPSRTSKRARATLEAAGFAVELREDTWELWVRPPAKSGPTSPTPAEDIS